MDISCYTEPSPETSPDGESPFKARLNISHLLLLIITAALMLTLTQPLQASDNRSAALEEIRLERQGVNANWIRIRESLLKENSGEPFNLPRAWSFTGHINLDGEQTALTAKGKGRLTYSLKEYFAGNLVIIYLYDPSSGEFRSTDQVIMNTISTGIELKDAELLLPFARTDDPENVKPFTITIKEFSPDRDEIFPGFHSEVIRGSAQGQNMELDIYSPRLTLPLEGEMITLDRFNSGIRIPLKELTMAAKGKDLFFNRKLNTGINIADLSVQIRFEDPELTIDLPDEEILVNKATDNDTYNILPIRAENLDKSENCSYRFIILKGLKKVAFPGGNREMITSSGEAYLELLAPGTEMDDVTLEVMRDCSGGQGQSDLISLTLRKPANLRSMEDFQLRERGYSPFISYREMLLEGRPYEINIPGKSREKITDGYSRMFLYQVFDQFGVPIRKEGLKGESRITLPEENADYRVGGTPLPVLMGYEQVPEGRNTFRKELFTGKEGLLPDRINLPVSGGSYGIPPDMEVTIEQRIYLMGWLLGSRQLHLTEKEMNAGPWKR